MLTDHNIERYPFSIVSGSSVNRVLPTSFVPMLLPSGLRIYTAGPKDSAALCKIVRPLFSTSPAFTRSFMFMADEGTAERGNAREFDVRITTADGWTYCFDMQINWAEGGMFQVATGVAAGDIQWKDTGFLVGAPAPGLAMPVTVECAYDTIKHVCSIQSVQYGKVVGMVPAALQNQPAVQLGWEPNQVVFQHQPSMGVTAGAMSDLIANDQLAYSGS